MPPNLRRLHLILPLQFGRADLFPDGMGDGGDEFGVEGEVCGEDAGECFGGELEGGGGEGVFEFVAEVGVSDDYVELESRGAEPKARCRGEEESVKELLTQKEPPINPP
jgi:hypothetical protein